MEINLEKGLLNLAEFLIIPEGFFFTRRAFISARSLTPLFRYCLEMFKRLYN